MGLFSDIKDKVVDVVKSPIGLATGGGTNALGTVLGLGSAVGGAWYNSAQAQRAFNRSLRADSTLYQRRVADLKAAGINPLLVGQLAGGGPISAAVPSMPDMAQSVASGAQAMRQNSEVSRIRQELRNLRATEDVAKADYRLREQQRQESEARTGLYTTEAQLAQLEVPYKNRLADLYNSEYGDTYALLKDTGTGGAVVHGASRLIPNIGAGWLKSKAKQFGKRSKGAWWNFWSKK